MKPASNLHLMLAVGTLGILLAACGATPIKNVDSSLRGTWHGDCELSLPIVFNPNQLPEDVERTRRAVALDITIDENSTVSGNVGEASIEQSVLKHNRGELGRRLNVASDYVIIDGHLSGPIVSGADENDLKSFSIPFNLADGHLRGSLMWRQGWKYPYPLCQVDLTRAP